MTIVIIIQTVSGNRYHDEFPFIEKEYQSLKRLLKNWRALNHFKMNSMYFNPANIEYIEVIVKDK